MSAKKHVVESLDTYSSILSNDSRRQETLIGICKKKNFHNNSHGVFWITGNVMPAAFPWPSKQIKLTKVLLIFEGLPVSIASLSEWRDWTMDSVKYGEVHVEIVDKEISIQEIERLIEAKCGNWGSVPIAEEEQGFSVGTRVALENKSYEKDNPDLLTATFGLMGELLTKIDWIRSSFSETSLSQDEKDEYLNKIKSLLSNPEKKDANGIDNAIVTKVPRKNLPSLLLRGETGVGKTLIAHYLNKIPGKKPTRIVIPEYLKKEDMFEYALFGYAKGAFTGGLEAGSCGLLLKNVGSVIFLDEIGDANDIIQAKLLAYLDDYRVQPRGWTGESFYCPTLVVAATNHNLEDLVKEKKFRADLLARFTDIEIIPPLRERKESFPYILDCLLQNNAINPGWEAPGKKGGVKRIGKQALEALEEYEFPDNFRELETILRKTCREVLRDGRDYICMSDLLKWMQKS